MSQNCDILVKNHFKHNNKPEDLYGNHGVTD